jgi:hypothetical protein
MAVVTNFGVPTGTAANGTTLMPKLQYRFRVNFLKLGTAEQKTEVTQNVISSSRPNLTHEEVVVDSYNSKMYLAGKHTWEPVTIVFRDDMNSNVIKQLGYQLNKQVDHADQSSAKSGLSYKFITEIETLDGGNGANGPEVFDKWELQGCFISNVQYGDLNYADSNMVQVTLMIRFDHAQHLIGQENVIGSKDVGSDGEVVF